MWNRLSRTNSFQCNRLFRGWEINNYHFLGNQMSLKFVVCDNCKIPFELYYFYRRIIDPNFHRSLILSLVRRADEFMVRWHCILYIFLYLSKYNIAILYIMILTYFFSLHLQKEYSNIVFMKLGQWFFFFFNMFIIINYTFESCNLLRCLLMEIQVITHKII